MREDSLPTELMTLKLEGTELTKTERKVLRLLARGHTLDRTAQLLGTGRETVKSQVRVARGRLGARNTTHAVAIAVSLELI
jgi:DNA-binding CsgD family transcriptional regulator